MPTLLDLASAHNLYRLHEIRLGLSGNTTMVWPSLSGEVWLGWGTGRHTRYSGCLAASLANTSPSLAHEQEGLSAPLVKERPERMPSSPRIYFHCASGICASFYGMHQARVLQDIVTAGSRDPGLLHQSSAALPTAKNCHCHHHYCQFRPLDCAPY